MARSRRRPSSKSNTVTDSNEAPDSNESIATTVTNTNNNTDYPVNTDRRMKMPLTADQIRGVYAKRRSKGQYVDLLNQFLESGDSGVSVKEEWATLLGDKKAQTIKQGFDNAKEKKDAPDGADAVDVIVDGEDVYLINRALIDVAAAA